MKKISYYLILLFVGLIFLNSCDNEPLDGDFVATSSQEVSEADCDGAASSIITSLASIVAAPLEQQQMLCGNLREMILGTISTCGDESGFLQESLDSLDDICMQ